VRGPFTWVPLVISSVGTTCEWKGQSIFFVWSDAAFYQVVYKSSANNLRKVNAWGFKHYQTPVQSILSAQHLTWSYVGKQRFRWVAPEFWAEAKANASGGYGECGATSTHWVFLVGYKPIMRKSPSIRS
jgi:hypothetical protein